MAQDKSVTEQNQENFLGKRQASGEDSGSEDGELERRLAHLRGQAADQVIQEDDEGGNSETAEPGDPQTKPHGNAAVDYSSSLISAEPVYTKAFMMTKEKATSLVPRAVLLKRKQQEDLEAQRLIEDRLRAEMEYESQNSQNPGLTDNLELGVTFGKPAPPNQVILDHLTTARSVAEHPPPNDKETALRPVDIDTKACKHGT